MPNRKTHVQLGVTAGTVAGAYRVARRRKRRPEKPVSVLHDALQIVGSGAGGYFGGRLPDVIEPATTPNHRGPAHSFVGTGFLVRLAGNLDRWEDGWRDQAEYHGESRRREWSQFQTASAWEAVQHLIKSGLHGLAELFFALLSGIPIGVVAGYVSHVVADGFTPKSVPIVGFA